MRTADLPDAQQAGDEAGEHLSVRAAQENPVQRFEERRRLETRVDRAVPVEDSLESLPRTRTEIVKHRHLMHAGDRAERCAAFGTSGLALEVVVRVGFEWDSGMPALLGTVVHQAVLADIKEAPAGPAMPLVGQPAAGVLLKMIEV